MSVKKEMAEYVEAMRFQCSHGSTHYTSDFIRGFQHGVEMTAACTQDLAAGVGQNERDRKD